MFPQLDFSSIQTMSVAGRTSKVRLDDCARPFEAGGSFADFLATLPDIL